jgi:hypothetical protein
MGHRKALMGHRKVALSDLLGFYRPRCACVYGQAEFYVFSHFCDKNLHLDPRKT